MNEYLPGLCCGSCGWYMPRGTEGLAKLSAPCMCPERDTLDFCPHCFRESPNPSPRGTVKRCGACGKEYTVTPPAQRSALAETCDHYADPSSPGEPSHNPTTTGRGALGSNPGGSTARQGCRAQRGAPRRKGQRSRGSAVSVKG